MKKLFYFIKSLSRCFKFVVLTFFVFASIPSAFSQDINWTSVPGNLDPRGVGPNVVWSDVGVGANGALWAIDSAGRTYRWILDTWTPVSGTFDRFRLSVDPQGNAWVLDGTGIYVWNGMVGVELGGGARTSGFTQIPGTMSDIGVGALGAVWGVNSAQKIYRWTGSTWTEMPGAATRISVDPQGNAWIVNASGQIYQWVNNSWLQRPGAARDIAACPTGLIYMVGTDGAPYQWNGSNWVKKSGGNLTNIACDAKGMVYATTTSQEMLFGRTKPPAPPPVIWVAASAGIIPANAVAAGRAADGKELFMCRAKWFDEASRLPDGVHPGKASRQSEGCHFGFNGMDLSGYRNDDYVVVPFEYEVAVSVSAGATWQPTSGRNFPFFAVVGGYETVENSAGRGRGYYLATRGLGICRANYQGGVHLGRTRPEFNGCKIAWGVMEQGRAQGFEVTIPEYEILVMAP